LWHVSKRNLKSYLEGNIKQDLWIPGKKGLTKTERNKYLSALKTIKRIIREKERSGEKGKHKRFIAYDHKAVFQDKEGNYQRKEGGGIFFNKNKNEQKGRWGNIESSINLV